MKKSEENPSQWQGMEVLCLANIVVPGGRRILGAVLGSDGQYIPRSLVMQVEEGKEVVPSGWVADLRPLDILNLNGRFLGQEVLLFDPWSLQIPGRMNIRSLLKSEDWAAQFLLAKNIELRPEMHPLLSFKCEQETMLAPVYDSVWEPAGEDDCSSWNLDDAWLLMGQYPSIGDEQAVLAVI